MYGQNHHCEDEPHRIKDVESTEIGDTVANAINELEYGFGEYTDYSQLSHRFFFFLLEFEFVLVNVHCTVLVAIGLKL